MPLRHLLVIDSGKLTEGTVQDLLTNSATHPHGIKVRLASGLVQIVLTGLTMSPTMDAAFPILPWIFAGRQSDRVQFRSRRLAADLRDECRRNRADEAHQQLGD